MSKRDKKGIKIFVLIMVSMVIVLLIVEIHHALSIFGILFGMYIGIYGRENNLFIGRKELKPTGRVIK